MNLQEHYYGFENLPNQWVDDNDKSYSDEFFDDKTYKDLYFDNFFDMDEMFGHENSLFGTKGLPVGHPNRTSKSFDYYNKMYGPMIVRVVKDNNLQEQINRIQEMMGVMNKKISQLQKRIDSEIESMKNICENMNSESEEVISFDACDFLDILDNVSVQDVFMNNNVVVIKILIKYSSVFEYVDEDAFIRELSFNLKKFIPKIKFETESINTKERNW